ARGFTSDGREAVEVDEESVRLSVEDSEMDEEHIDHVDPTIPGIIAHLHHRTPEGELLQGHVLIDGHHRGARCLRDGLPFFAYLPRGEGSRPILVMGPERPRRKSKPAEAASI